MSSEKVIVVGQGVELRRVLALLEEDERIVLAGVISWDSQDSPGVVASQLKEIEAGSRLLGRSGDMPALLLKHGKSVVLALPRPKDHWEALGFCRRAAPSLA